MSPFSVQLYRTTPFLKLVVVRGSAYMCVHTRFFFLAHLLFTKIYVFSCISCFLSVSLHKNISSRKKDYGLFCSLSIFCVSTIPPSLQIEFRYCWIGCEVLFLPPLRAFTLFVFSFSHYLFFHSDIKLVTPSNGLAISVHPKVSTSLCPIILVFCFLHGIFLQSDVFLIHLFVCWLSPPPPLIKSTFHVDQGLHLIYCCISGILNGSLI